MIVTTEVVQRLYQKVKDKTVTFSQSVIAQTGLIANRTSFRLQGFDHPCVLYSSSLEEAKMLAPISNENLERLKENKNRIALRLVFWDPDDSKKEISLFLKAEIQSFNPYKGDSVPVYFLMIRYLTAPPADLIRIFGLFWAKKQDVEMRIHERIVINNLVKNAARINPMESFLFIDGNGKKCILSEISILSAKIIISGVSSACQGKSGLLIIKSLETEGMGEMLGKIDRVDVISEKDSLYSLIIVFDQERVPPLYKMWIGNLLETLARKAH